jgi:DNA-binding MarR family transcriptional regulator
MLAAAEKRREFITLGLAEFNAIAYITFIRASCLLEARTHNSFGLAELSPPARAFTTKQGQYLAYIYAYTRLHRRPPAETDMQEYFRVSPPSVHQMVLTLERLGFTKRQPRTARSIELLVDPKRLPELL